MLSFLDPNDILKRIDLRKNMVAAEFGCGSGSFTIPLARKLEEGLVFALDVQDAPLSALKSRSLLEKVINLRIIRADLEKPRGSTLQDSSLDVVFVINVLFQIEKKSEIITEARRVLKKEGKLVVVDWLPEVSQGPTEGRISPERLKKIAEDSGLKLEKEFKTGQYHYGLVFSRT